MSYDVPQRNSEIPETGEVPEERKIMSTPRRPSLDHIVNELAESAADIRAAIKEVNAPNPKPLSYRRGRQ